MTAGQSTVMERVALLREYVRTAGASLLSLLVWGFIAGVMLGWLYLWIRLARQHLAFGDLLGAALTIGLLIVPSGVVFIGVLAWRLMRLELELPSSVVPSDHP